MNRQNALDVREHLRREHKQSTLAVYLKEVVYGGVDGIITTFAVVAGFSGAALSHETTTQLSFMVVLLFGVANLFADGVSMGLGNFLAVRSDQKVYCSIRAKEKHESDHNRQTEFDETIILLCAKGFSETDARTLAEIYQKNPEYWLDFMMNHELKMPDPTDENPVYTSLATTVAFIGFGSIPLIPFVFLHSTEPQVVFWISTLSAFFALVLLGLVKWRVIGTGLPQAVGEIVGVGTVAGLVAFGIGTLFKV
jgi:VIT1/CCC1 family predicted Fe2+/Mn2+ transporter